MYTNLNNKNDEKQQPQHWTFEKNVGIVSSKAKKILKEEAFTENNFPRLCLKKKDKQSWLALKGCVGIYFPFLILKVVVLYSENL